MSYFSGCHTTLVMTSVITFFLLSITWEVRGDNPLFEEMSSRQEMVQLAGYGEEKLSTVIATGTVLCEACLNAPHDQPRAWPIPGALVSINCPTKSKLVGTRHIQMATTDEYGDFTIDLPSHLHAISNLESVCCVEVLRVPKHSGCKPAFVNKHKTLTLTSLENGIRNYSAGKINLLHSTSKPSNACSKKGNAQA